MNTILIVLSALGGAWLWWQVVQVRRAVREVNRMLRQLALEMRSGRKGVNNDADL